MAKYTLKYGKHIPRNETEGKRMNVKNIRDDYEHTKKRKREEEFVNYYLKK